MMQREIITTTMLTQPKSLWHWVSLIFVLACITAIVITPNVLSGRFDRDLAFHPDEAAHFSTGIMVYDYVTTGIGENPIEFAESFYIRYPKVAFGQWPPLLYLVQSVWFGIFGPTKFSAMLLTCAITIGAASLPYTRLKQSYGGIIALCSVVAFLTTTLVQSYSSAVMAESLVCLCSLLAYFAFCDYFLTGKTRHVVWFIVWTSAAILTKGTGLALVLFALFAPVANGKTNTFKGRAFWITLLLIAAISVPFYLFIIASSLHNQSNVESLFTGVARFPERLPGLWQLFHVYSPLIYVVACVGIVTAFRQPRESAAQRRKELESATAVAWFLAIVVFHILCPVSLEVRYFMPAMLPLTILFAHGLSESSRIGLRMFARQCNASTGRPNRTEKQSSGRQIEAGMCTTISQTIFAIGVPLLLTGLAMGTSPGNLKSPVFGYSTVANALPYNNDGQVILISSDPCGGGAFIAERQMHNRGRSGFVLRANKVLADSNWSGSRYELRLESMEEIRKYLNDVPVHYVVIDDFEGGHTHHRMLCETLDAAPDNFEVSTVHSVFRDGRECPRAIRVYENLHARNRRPEVVRVDMNRKLGHVLEVWLTPLKLEHAERNNQ